MSDDKIKWDKVIEALNNTPKELVFHRKETIKYTEEFHTPYGTKIWVGKEVEIDANRESSDSVFQEILSWVRDQASLATGTSFQNNVNGVVINAQQVLPEIEVKDFGNPLEMMRDAILQSKHIKNLETFGFLVDRKFPELKELYNQKHKELTNG